MFEQTVPGLTYQQEHILMMLQAFTFIRFADASVVSVLASHGSTYSFLTSFRNTIVRK